jgi:hypothetical protein
MLKTVGGTAGTGFIRLEAPAGDGSGQGQARERGVKSLG